MLGSKNEHPCINENSRRSTAYSLVGHAVQNDIYDPDDVGLQDSPPLRPLQPKLQPTPSPPPYESDSEDVKPVPSQGDAVLIDLLGNGKALEVARDAATSLLPADNGKHEVNTTWRKSDHAIDLKALAAGALNVVNHHTAYAATAPNDQVLPPLNKDRIAHRPNHHESHDIQGSDKLAPIRLLSPELDNANSTTLPSISAQLGLLAHLADIATGRVDNKDPSSNARLSNPPTTSNSQIISTPLGSQRLLSISTDDNPSQEPQSSSPFIVAVRPTSTKTELQGFKCPYPGCTAQPFQTKYLLTSHANVHSSDRPHYCPVKGCPRGEGGKGFKRKNEMIRHDLVHQSPGYLCPYCIDKNHKYPRPDNLQRHIRIHHVDKDKDDPQLREILAQRPEGRRRDRRRRGHDRVSNHPILEV